VASSTSTSRFIAIGDIVGQPMLAHKAVHEAHLAAKQIAVEALGPASASTDDAITTR
jgi:pyruvate/2-oxoglutarate dehydrogenase complex dihydrolipoamide dehydrogenase (E3) component